LHGLAKSENLSGQVNGLAKRLQMTFVELQLLVAELRLLSTKLK